MRRVLISFLMVTVTALVVGGGVYVWQSSSSKTELDVLKGDNTSLKLRVNELESTSSQAPAEPAPPPPPASAPASDQDAVIALVKADCSAQKEVDLAKSTFGGVVKIDTAFAWVNFNCNGTGANRAILKKTDAGWSIVYKGTKAPPKATIDLYAIPKEYQ